MIKKFLEDDSRKNELVKQTYHLIHKRRTVTKANLIEHMQSKPTTMTRVIEELLQNGWIKEGDLAHQMEDGHQFYMRYPKRLLGSLE